MAFSWKGRNSGTLVLCLLSLLLALTVHAQTGPAWQPNTSYAAGALVTFNGVTYTCIQAHTSEVGWEPPNAPALWQPASGSTGGGCTAAPSAPGGLTASATTSAGASLNWSAASAPSGCSISGYTVFQNGSAIASLNGTSFSVSGLLPSTQYSFTVAASDSAGMSAPSAPVSVTTLAGGSGSGCAPAWNASTAYATAGTLVSVNGVNYKNNFWTQGQNPATSSGPAGSGQPWTAVGSCASCATVPPAPAGLTASGTTSCSTNLSWTASTAPSNCSLSGYTVFDNGSLILNGIPGTSTSVFGLQPSSSHKFSVAASDSAGTSPQSAALSVTTPAGSCGGTGGGRVFAPYMDISLGVGEQVVTLAQQANLKAIILSFMVDGGCTAVWGGLGGTTFPNGTSVIGAVQQLQANGTAVYIAFGGANGSVLSSCSTVSGAQAMYQAVVNTYHPSGLDMDIEGGVNAPVLMQALAGLKSANPGLILSLTLPVLPSGLVTAGTDLLAAAHQAGFNPDLVNVMAMDYGSGTDGLSSGQTMGSDAIAAAQNTLTQVKAAGLNSPLGVTALLGVNDTNTEIFNFNDANTLLSFANSNSFISRLAYWSLARDNGGCAGAGFASPTCSGLAQSSFQFASVFNAFH